MRHLELNLAERSLPREAYRKLIFDNAKAAAVDEPISLRVVQCGGSAGMETLCYLLAQRNNQIRELVINLYGDDVKLLAPGLLHVNCQINSLCFEHSDLNPDLPALLTRFLEHKPCDKLQIGRIAFKELEQAHRFFDAAFNYSHIKHLRIFLPEVEDWICLITTIPTVFCLYSLQTRIYNGYNPAPFFDAIAQSDIMGLDVSGSYLFKSGCIDLANALPHTQLAVLNVKGCRIGREGGLALVRALQACPRLVDLDLGFNHLTDEPVRELISSTRFPALNRLVLEACGFGNETGRAMALALRKQKCAMTELDISQNQLLDSAVCAFAETLESANCNLHTLLLSHTTTGNASSRQVVSRALARALRSPNCKLTVFHIGRNLLDEVDSGDEDDEEEEDGEEEEEEDDSALLEYTMHCMDIGRNLLALCAARRHPPSRPRAAATAAAVARLPQEIIRLVATFLI